MSWLNIVKVVLELVPLVVNTIKTIEGAIGGSGKGAEKLAMLRNIIESAYNTAQDATVKFEQIWPALESIVKTVVSTFNTIGVFKK